YVISFFLLCFFFFFQAEDGIRDLTVTGVQTCALPISRKAHGYRRQRRPSRDSYCAHDRRKQNHSRLGLGNRYGFRRDHALRGTHRRPPHDRSEEHTSELQSQSNLVCRLLLEKKNKTIQS